MTDESRLQQPECAIGERMLPSLDDRFVEGRRTKPRILVLEVRDRKNVDGSVIARIMVEREEQFERSDDGSIWNARIRLSYRLLETEVFACSGQGEFEGCYSGLDNRLSLTTTSSVWEHGFVTLDLPRLKGQRIGTYLMNEIVCWVQRWPGADVNSIQLLAGQAQGSNTARRNRFYERFGFVFDYENEEHRAGESRPIKVSDLRQVDGWKANVSERKVMDCLNGALEAASAANRESKDLLQTVSELSRERLAAEAHPLWWTTKAICRQRGRWLLAALTLAIAFVPVVHFMKQMVSSWR
jgi:GNAT superfamily N-acetyltransferase